MQNSKNLTGVLLMTYGSATVAEHVAEYFAHIYKGKAPKTLIVEFERRYRLVGHSPLVEITKRQAKLLQSRLGKNYVVRAAMRHSAPFIKDAVKECKAAGATTLVGVVLSPQYSPLIMGGYPATLTEAALQNGFLKQDITIAGPWPTEKHFIQLLASRVTESLQKLRALYGTSVPVVFTTHSLPRSVVEKDAKYLEQIKATTDAIVATLQDPALEHYNAYQSAGHTPEQWLKPDITDILCLLHNKKNKSVLLVPVQFLADHLEVLYDLDIAAKKQCEEYDIAYHRIALPNTDQLFVEALAGVVRGTFA